MSFSPVWTLQCSITSDFHLKGFSTFRVFITHFSSVNCLLLNKHGAMARDCAMIAAMAIFSSVTPLRTNSWLKRISLHLLHLYCLALVWIFWCGMRTELPLKDFTVTTLITPITSGTFWCTTNEDLYLISSHLLHTKLTLSVQALWSEQVCVWG